MDKRLDAGKPLVAGLRQAENTGTQEVRHQVTTEMLQKRGEMMGSGEQ